MERSYAHRSLVTEEQVRWQPLCACILSYLSRAACRPVGGSAACHMQLPPAHAHSCCSQPQPVTVLAWLGAWAFLLCAPASSLAHIPDQPTYTAQIGTLAAYLAGEDPRSLTAARCREVAGQLQMPYQAVRGPCCVELAGALDASGCTGAACRCRLKR